MQIFQLLRSEIYVEGGGWKPPFHGLLSGVGRGVEAGSLRSMGYAVGSDAGWRLEASVPWAARWRVGHGGR